MNSDNGKANTAQKSIKFNFQMFSPEKKEHVVEKADSTGQKRRYIRGISSGILKDGDGERMTMTAIDSMHDQAQKGDILFFSGKHGVNFTDDIGILTDSSIINNQDWFTEYRLYDEADRMGAMTLERADKVFLQVSGLPPYKKPKEYGFSIEGVIPDGSILSQKKMEDGTVKNRVINHVDLQGVVLVSKPSYANVAASVYKALGELQPAAGMKLHKDFQSNFRTQLQNEEMRDSFYRQQYSMNDALMDSIEKIMLISDGRASERLQILFEEYSPAMIELILQHEEAFQRDGNNLELETQKGIENLASKLGKLSSMILKRLEA